MDIKSLAIMGIGEKSAKVYLAGLALGTTSVQDLARKSGLKRPTTYLHLDDLVGQGLMEHVVLNKKKYYRAVEPRVLEERLKKGLAHLQAEMPHLLAMQANTMGRPQVQMFEGEEGVKQVYEETKRAGSLRVWSNLDNGPRLFHDLYMDMSEAMRQRSINTKEIIADNPAARRYSRLVAKVAGPSYTARTATAEGLYNDTVIYDDVVAIFCLQGLNMFVVRIEDPTIAESMRAMFEMAWKTARPFK